MDWLDLLSVQGTLKCLLQHHSSKASVLQCSALSKVQLSHPHMTTGKTVALSIFSGFIIIEPIFLKLYYKTIKTINYMNYNITQKNLYRKKSDLRFLSLLESQLKPRQLLPDNLPEAPWLQPLWSRPCFPFLVLCKEQESCLRAWWWND